ncbi:MAG: carboxypeptidase-like regulatory domain-containing protein, partial [bacterium]
ALSVARVMLIAGASDSAWTTTDASGRYQLAMAIRGGPLAVLVTLPGYTSRRISIVTVGRDTSLVLDIQLTPQTTTLATVKVVAPRPRVRRDEGGSRLPGQNGFLLESYAGASGDQSGNLNMLLAMTPGIIPSSSAGGGSQSTAFGMSGELNSFVLNGVEAPPVSWPRDGLLRTVRLATYDPKFGHFAAVQVGATLTCGCDYENQSARLTTDQPIVHGSFADGAAISRSFVASGWMAGTLVPEHQYYSLVFQGSRRAIRTPGLADLSNATITTLGIDPGALNRASAAASAIGLGRALGGAASSVADDGSFVARIDLLPGPPPTAPTSGATLYLLTSGSLSRTSAAVPLTSSPLRGVSTTRTTGQVAMVLAPYLFSALSETKASVTTSNNRSVPVSGAPAVALVTASESAGTAFGSSGLQLGGSGFGDSNETRTTWRLTNETLWLSRDGRQRFQIAADVSRTGVAIDFTPNGYGAFSFQSIDALDANRPSLFVRRLGEDVIRTNIEQAALGLSHLVALGENARSTSGNARDATLLQYGIRLEHEGVGEVPQRNPEVVAAFGRRTDATPSIYAIAPMAGISLTRGVYREDGAMNMWDETDRHYVTLGIRQYRGVLSPQSVARSNTETGLPSSTRQLECIGAAVPIPTWSTYLADPSRSPMQCASVNGSPLSTLSTPVTLFAKDFSSPSSWRADVNWRYRASGHWYVSVGATGALNNNEAQPYDLNFGDRTKFTLIDEAQRPVFSPFTGVDAATGLVSSAGSRSVASFGRVTELRSDLHSVEEQVVLASEWRIGQTSLSAELPDAPRVNGVLRLSYTNAAGRTRRSGFADLTAGDPRKVDEFPLSLPRHTIQAIFTGEIARWGSFSFSARMSSGMRYTPAVSTDINGDGFANDRAFVFAPGSFTDSANARTMRDLVAGQACLQHQQKTIAAPNSCVGDWSIGLGAMSIEIDPARVGLAGRGTLAFHFNNVLSGIDHVLHGSHGVHGWGNSSFPDPVLLRVNGFDPQLARFRYAVNPGFGKNDRSLVTAAPFRVAVDLQFDVGKSREEREIDRVVSYAVKYEAIESEAKFAELLRGWAEPRSQHDVARILTFSDSLRLTDAQVARLTEIEERRRVTTDSIYTRLAHSLYLVRANPGSVRQMWHDDIGQSLRAAVRAGEGARDVLTPQQLQMIRSGRIAPLLFYSPSWLERTLAGTLTPR